MPQPQDGAPELAHSEQAQSDPDHQQRASAVAFDSIRSYLARRGPDYIGHVDVVEVGPVRRGSFWAMAFIDLVYRTDRIPPCPLPC